MARQSRAQKETVSRVMHEFAHGELKTSRGRKVRNSKQAIAIGLSEAGASSRQAPQRKKQALRRTKDRERRGATAKARTEGRGGARTRAELYREAQRRRVPGRSRMTKAELEKALRR